MFVAVADNPLPALFTVATCIVYAMLVQRARKPAANDCSGRRVTPFGEQRRPDG